MIFRECYMTAQTDKSYREMMLVVIVNSEKGIKTENRKAD